MNDEEKTREQLISEITELRHRVAEMEVAGTDYSREKQRMGEHEVKYETVMEETPIAICNMDINGKVTFVNKRFERLSGYSREEIVNKYRFKLGVFPPETLKLFEEHANRRLKGEPAPLVETQFKCKDGRWRWWEVEARAIHKQGELVGLQLAARDVTERRRLMEVLGKSEEQLKQVFEFAPDALYMIDMKGVFVEWNRAAEKITGYKKHELMGKSFLASRLFDPTHIPKAAELLAKNAMGQATGPDEFNFNRKDGTQVIVEIRTFPIKTRNRELIAGIARDITVHKRAEDALQKVHDELEDRLRERTEQLSSANALLTQEISERKQGEERLGESEEKYQTVLKAIEEGYYEVDLEGKLTLFSDSLCRIYGYAKDELVGMNCRQYMDLENAEKVFQAFNEIYNSGNPVRGFDHEIIKKGGETRHLRLYASLMKDSEGHPAGFRGIVQDVTEIKQMEWERSSLQNILDSSPDCITTTDLHGNTLYVSPHVKNILGYDTHELTGKKTHFLYRNGIEDAKKIMRELSDKGELRNHDIKVRNKDGRLIDIDLSASLLLDKRGGAIGTLGIYRNLTERNKLQARLQHAVKMEAIRTLAGGTAHHFNNLLMGIQGNASLVLLDITSTHPHYEKLREIEQFVQNGADLATQLLGFSADGAAEYEVKPTNLSDLVKQSTEIFGRTKKEITIHSRYQEDCWSADVDQGRIEQVLLTLYENAREAMPGGGDLYIETENVVLDRDHVGPYSLEPGNYVRISVTDTGVGMSRDIKEKAFEPFFTTKQVGKGVGLSLASAYGIIRNHAGIISIYSEEGKGTTCTLYLPSSEKEPAIEEKSPPEAVRGSETVLLVDDQDIVIDIGTQMLERMGYTVLLARSGKEATEVYKGNIDKIDIVILDMIMPGMSGGETYDALKAIKPDVKVLLSSGYTINAEATEILERGCSGFIQKPLTMRELSQKIREILD
jgi:two-component system cell cycle sensor histidine kinase/response regulator CckA